MPYIERDPDEYDSAEDCPRPTHQKTSAPTTVRNGVFDFYECKKCGRLITKPEMTAGLAIGKVCPCGALRYSPRNLRWFDWLRPRVLVFAWQRARGAA